MSRVYFASDDTVFCEMLRKAFKREGGLDLYGEAKIGVEAVMRVLKLVPDLVILEAEKPQQCDFEIAQTLKANMPEIPVFLVTHQHDMQAEKHALAQGIDAVFDKSDDLSSLLMNVRAVCGLE